MIQHGEKGSSQMSRSIFSLSASIDITKCIKILICCEVYIIHRPTHQYGGEKDGKTIRNISFEKKVSFSSFNIYIYQVKLLRY